MHWFDNDKPFFGKSYGLLILVGDGWPMAIIIQDITQLFQIDSILYVTFYYYPYSFKYYIVLFWVNLCTHTKRTHKCTPSTNTSIQWRTYRQPPNEDMLLWLISAQLELDWNYIYFYIYTSGRAQTLRVRLSPLVKPSVICFANTAGWSGEMNVNDKKRVQVDSF